MRIIGTFLKNRIMGNVTKSGTNLMFELPQTVTGYN